MDPEPQRPDRRQRCHQPLPRVGEDPATGHSAACRRPPGREKRSRSYPPSRNCRCAAAPARRRHQDRERHGDAHGSASRYGSCHAKPEWTTSTFAKYAQVKAQFQPAKFPFGWSQREAFRSFSRPRCAILALDAAFLRTDDARNALRPLPARSDMEIELTKLSVAPDLPGADAGVPGAVRARQWWCSTSRSSTAFFANPGLNALISGGAADRHHPRRSGR